MFKSNSPKECLDAGISPSDKDAPRKCAKIMFSLNAPQECIDAGIIGESRDDEIHRHGSGRKVRAASCL